MLNKENSYKLKQDVFLNQCYLHLAKWSIGCQIGGNLAKTHINRP